MAKDKLTIDAPEITAPTGGLLSVAPVTTGETHAFYKGVEYNERFDSGLLIFGDQNEAVDGKTFSDRTSNSLVEADPITAYLGVDVLLFDRESAKAQLEASFSRNESRSLEKVFQRDVLNVEAVDLTPAAGVAVTEPSLAAGILEQWFGENYGGRPVLHTTRLGANLLEDILEYSSGFSMHTRQGSPLAYGSGYGQTGPAAAVAGADEAWVYVTGDVEFLRSQVLAQEEGFNLPGNRARYLTEVQYIPLVNGPVGAILIGAK